MTSYSDIVQARKRIASMIHQTPIIESSLLNEWLGSRILFKGECLQRTGAFKVRGAINTLAKLAEQNALPKQVVANSSGNHAQAVAYACSLYDIPAKIFSTQNVSAVKAQATQYYGAELALYPTRLEADEAVKQASVESGTLWIPPFNHPDIIAGQGTLVMDALEQTGDVDGIFAPCGGGGLLSGTLIAAKTLCPAAKVFGAEPLTANDAAESLRQNKIISLSKPPITLADGAATPSVGEHTFEVLKLLDGIVEVSESRIAYWTQWLQHLLKLHLEPTSAMSMQAVVEWLKHQPKNQTVLVLLSGGNIDQSKMQQIWSMDHLGEIPNL
ncbi:serine/threonine dehydratase [Aliiglaciecola sp. 3_MG-2023]|uniref:serine/threonine dehydratase n=1 Tax=Aliiglaciecola sp. 3_MG-2023 TaxID=3062644 RepID=UPI0026E3657C|nr:serine/threonine dehydratase [Aliiglaciecola sp. 3_MG-2023]MDO6692181.1 serine/threonine dehydratase [Aliiglaciecola sp. 3_MG-2023]